MKKSCMRFIKEAFRIIFIIFFVNFYFMTPAFTQSDSDSKDALMLEHLHRMRLKAQNNETVIRAQVFKTIEQENVCRPVQQTRQRLRDIKDYSDAFSSDITVNAGHEEFNVQDNHGTINSDINVQIIKQGSTLLCP